MYCVRASAAALPGSRWARPQVGRLAGRPTEAVWPSEAAVGLWLHRQVRELKEGSRLLFQNAPHLATPRHDPHKAALRGGA